MAKKQNKAQSAKKTNQGKLLEAMKKTLTAPEKKAMKNKMVAARMIRKFISNTPDEELAKLI